MTFADIPSLNDDPAFIAIGQDFARIEKRRVAILKERYGVQGHVSLGGDVRPRLGLCNIGCREMFDGREPRIGDVVILGYLYGDSSAEVVIGRLCERFDNVADRPQPDLPGYRFEWKADPIAVHSFGPVGHGIDYREDRSEPEGEVGVDFVRKTEA